MSCEHGGDQIGIDSIELPYYATYSKSPRGGRVILPPEHQIQFTPPLPWGKSKELGELNSDVRITATNKAKPRSIEMDLEEDVGAYATFIPVTYQLPPSDEVIRTQINTPEMNAMSDKLDSLRDDVTKSISQLRRSGTCRLCRIFNTADSKSGQKHSCSGNGVQFHGREANYYKPHLTFNPELDFEESMKRSMNPRSRVRYTDDGDDWGLANPIRKVQDEINKKAAAMHVESHALKRNLERERFRKALILPEPYEEEDFMRRPSPLPRYSSSRYPTDHLLTRRRGYKFIC